MDENIRNVLKNSPGAHPGYFNSAEQKCLSTLVECGEVIVRHVDGVPHYYLPAQAEFCSDLPKVPLAARLHNDGSIHVYFNGEDVGIKISSDKISLSNDRENVVLKTDDDELWLVRGEDLCAAQDKISELTEDVVLATDVNKMLFDRQSNRDKPEILSSLDTINKQSKRIDELIDERIRLHNDLGASVDASKIAAQEASDYKLALQNMIERQAKRIDEMVAERLCLIGRVRELHESAEKMVPEMQYVCCQNDDMRKCISNLEGINILDRDRWKRRETDMSAMVADRDKKISEMNTTLRTLWERAETWRLSRIKGEALYNHDYDAMDNIHIKLTAARGKDVFTDDD